MNNAQQTCKPLGLSSVDGTNKDDDCFYEQTIKLSVVTQFFPPDYAATGQLIEELVQQLEQQGVEIDVFTSQPGYAFRVGKAPRVELREQTRIHRSRTAHFWCPQCQKKNWYYVRQLDDGTYDVRSYPQGIRGINSPDPLCQ